MVDSTGVQIEQNEGNEILVVNDPEQYPHVILKGSLANLSALRQGDSEMRSRFFADRYGVCQNDGDDDQEHLPLLMEPSIRATIVLGSTTTTSVSGEVFVTQSQVLFVASDQEQVEHDLAIGASCIILHAMTDDPHLAIYLQLNTSEDETVAAGEEEEDQNDDAGARPLDVTITPLDGGYCQPLFDTLCKLVSLHPVLDDDDENDWQGGFGGDDDELIWAPAASSAFGTAGEDDDGATEEERAVMLERLDNLLVVRPEFEIQDGQFDDADSSDGDNE